MDSNESTKDTIIMRMSADEESPSFSAAAFSRSFVSVSSRMGMALSFSMVKPPYHIRSLLTSGGTGRRSRQNRERKFPDKPFPRGNTIPEKSKLANRIPM